MASQCTQRAGRRPIAGPTAEIPREGERYDARQRGKEELVSAAWREGRADPRVANKLDGFMTAARQRLDEEGALNASRAANSSPRVELPGVGREHQAGMAELACSFIQAREGMTLSKNWDQQIEREAAETEKWQAWQNQRERRGLTRAGAGPRAAERGSGAWPVTSIQDYITGCHYLVRTDEE